MTLKLLLFAMFRTVMMLLWMTHDNLLDADARADIVKHIDTLDERWLAYDRETNP